MICILIWGSYRLSWKNSGGCDQKKWSTEASADSPEEHASEWAVMSHYFSKMVITVTELIQSLFLWSMSKKCSGHVLNIPGNIHLAVTLSLLLLK